MMDILICICIILILLIIHAAWPGYCFTQNKYESISLEKFERTIDTGDILLFRMCCKCKYKKSWTGDVLLDNAFIYTYGNLFNSLRGYVIEKPYTHVAIIIKIKERPYIVHMDGNYMFDELLQQWISGASCVVSGMQHLNRRGGVIHLHKYIGPRITKDMEPCIKKNRNTTYPSFSNLIKVNGLKADKHLHGIQACTDFVENVLAYSDIIKKEDVTRQSSIKDICTIATTHPLYNHSPIALRNKCYKNKHF